MAAVDRLQRPVRNDAGGRKPLLLCLSHLRWDFVYQRPQHLLTRAARHYDVCYFEEPVYQPGAQPHLQLRREACGVTVAAPVLPDWTPHIGPQQRELLDEFLAPYAGRPLIVWYYTPAAMAFSDHLSPDVCVYDNMDELSAFVGADDDIAVLEARLFSRADVVFTGGRSLYEAKRHRHANIHAFPSSIDSAHFAAARVPTREPDDQQDIAHPRIGFFGVIDERMDRELVRSIAEARPDWELVMLGPVCKLDWEELPQRENIHWLGPKSYESLPQYLAGWDLGFMPFALNRSTRFISPTKTLEFLAAGVPVVSTAINDVVHPYGDAGLVEIASDAGAFVRAAEKLMGKPRAPWLARVDSCLAATSWDKTWAAMRGLIDAAGSVQAPARRTRSAAM